MIYEDALSNNELNKSINETSTEKNLNNSVELNKKEIQHNEYVAGLVTDEPERVGDVSPSRQPESTIIHIKGLTRPFTILQLKDLLSKYGKIIDSKFWINNVKSHCYATVRNFFHFIIFLNIS